MAARTGGRGWSAMVECPPTCLDASQLVEKSTTYEITREKSVKVIAKTDEYTIYQKRNERYAVKDADRAWINGDQKTAILLEHKLIDAPQPKAPEPEVAEEAPAEEASAEEDAAEETEEAKKEAE